MIEWRIIFERITSIIKTVSLLWVCLLWPLFHCLSVISDKYWGDDNLFEQVVEAYNKWETGISVDISADSSNPEPNDLKKYIPSER